MNKSYTIDSLYANSEIVATELKIYLKGNELEKFQKQPFYAELIKYLDSIGKTANSPDVKTQKGCPTGSSGKAGKPESESALPDSRYCRLFDPIKGMRRGMWVPKKEWDELNKKITGLEAKIHDQQKIFLLHIQDHEKSVAELKQIFNEIKECYNGM